MPWDETQEQLRFFASLQDTYEEADRHYATFYLIDDSLNKNNWRVTGDALLRALPGLVGKPVSAKPGYRVDHVSEPLDVGVFTKVDKSDGYAIGTAEIKDPIAWEKLKAKDWGPVSVELSAFQISCSKCGKDILTEPCEHVQSGEAHKVITDFRFDRFAFVDDPAYPMAGLLYAAGKLQSRNSDEPTGALNPATKKGEENFMEDEKIAELEDKLKNVATEKTELESKLAEAEKKLEAAKESLTGKEELESKKGELDTQVQELKAQLDAIKAERHLERVNGVVDLRVQAGLAEDRKAEAKRLEALDDKTLEIMKADAKVFAAERERMAKLLGPKAKFTAASQDELQEKIEETRQRLFGHRSTPETGGAN